MKYTIKQEFDLNEDHLKILKEIKENKSFVLEERSDLEVALIELEKQELIEIDPNHWDTICYATETGKVFIKQNIQ